MEDFEIERARQTVLKFQDAMASWVHSMLPAFRQLGEAICNLRISLLWECARILKKKTPTEAEISLLYILVESDDFQHTLLEDERFGVTKETKLFLRGELYALGSSSRN